MIKIFNSLGLILLALVLGASCGSEPPQKIYLWSKVSSDFSPTLKAEHVEPNNLVLSGDGKHLYAYAYLKKDLSSGLYYSSNMGSSWTKIKELKAKPIPAATTDAEVADTKDLKASLVMKASSKGIALLHDKKAFILEGKNVKWGIDTAIHYFDAVGGNEISEITQNEVIDFINIVHLGPNKQEKLVFAQRGLSTLYLKNLDVQAPISIDVQDRAGKELGQLFIVAGNTANGDLLLGTSDEGIWQIPFANLSGANLGKVSEDAPVLKPDTVWDKSNGPLSIGTFDNTYYALTEKGLAYHKGKQGNAKENFTSFGEMEVKSIVQEFMGGPMLVPYVFIFGLNRDGTLNHERDLHPALISKDKNHMMKDNKGPVGFSNGFFMFSGLSASNDGKKAVTMATDFLSGTKQIYFIEESLGEPRK